MSKIVLIAAAAVLISACCGSSQKLKSSGENSHPDGRISTQLDDINRSIQSRQPIKK